MKFKIDYHIDSIYSLNLDFFLHNSFKYVVIDLDQTLDSPFASSPSTDAISLKKRLNDLGITMIVISNNKAKRVRPYCEKLNVDYLPFAKKHSKKKILKFLQSRDIKVSDCLFIGDQLLTDGIYTRKINGKFLLVEPLTKVDNIFTKVNRKIDIIIRGRLKRNNKLGLELGGIKYDK